MGWIVPILLTPFLVVFIISAKWILSLSIILAGLFFLLILPMVKAGWSDLPRIWLSFLSLLVILLFDQLFGREADIRLFLFSLAIGSFYHFTRNEPIHRGVQFFLSAIAFWPIELFEPQLFAPMVEPQTSQLLGMLNIPLVFLTLLFNQLNYLKEVKAIEKEQKADILERDELIREKTHLEQNFRQAMRMASMGSFSADLDTGLFYPSPELLGLFGFEEKEEYSMEDLYELIPREEWPRFREKLDTLTPNKGHDSLEHCITNSRGETFCFNMNFRKEKDKTGKLFLHGLIHDITNEVLEQRHLTSRIMETEGETRSQASHELNEEVSQNLSVTKLHLERILEQMDKERKASTDIKDSLEDVTSIVHQTLEKTKRITQQLVPPSLKDLGLEAALQELAQQYERKAPRDLEVNFVQTGPSSELPFLPRMILFRMVDDLLRTILERGTPQRITIRSHNEEKAPELWIQIEEDSPLKLFGERPQENRKKDRAYMMFLNQVKALHGSFDVGFDPLAHLLCVRPDTVR